MLIAPLAFFFSGPFSVLATAAGAVSVPVIIHLLNRKRFRVVTWAAMRFLLAAQKKNSRRLRLEQLILLAIRALVVLLVLLAMASVTRWAEDFWAKYLPEGASLSTPGGRRTHRILVIDGSLSMGLKTGDTTCFEKARAVAQRIVEESKDLGRGDGFSIVMMTATGGILIGGSETGPAEKLDGVLESLKGLRLSHGNSDLARSLDRVAQLLKGSPGQFVEKEVYFLTDLQKTSWVLPQPGEVATALETLRSRARTILVDVGVEEPPRNLAITDLELKSNDLVVTKGREVTFSATVHNYGTQTQDTVPVTLHVGRLRSKPGDAPFALRETVPEGADRMQRGRNTVNLKHKFTAAGDYVVQVRLPGDALDLDDVRSIIVHVRDEVPVMLVNGKPAADLYDQATEYLFDALNPYQDGRSASPIRVRKLAAAEFADAGLGNLAGQDCVFLCDVPRISAAEAQRLEAHVRRGGGLVISLGPNAARNLDSYNDFLYRNGRGLLPARLVGRQSAPKGYYFHFAADDQAFKLPPLSAFEKERDKARLLNAPFAEFVRADLPSSSVAGVSPRKVLSFVARPEKPDAPKSSDAAAYLREPAVVVWQPPLPNKDDRSRGPVPSSRGRVVLLTSTVNADWTDWPRQGSFVWFMQEVLGHAAAGRLREQSQTVGEILEEYGGGRPGTEEQEGKEVTLHTPDGREEKTKTVAREESVLWRWSDTDISGVYRAVIGSSPEERAFAVNVPSSSDDQHGSESDLTRTTQEELQKIYPEWDFQIVRDLADVKRDAKTSSGDTVEYKRQELGSGIARWLLIVALVLMAIEVVLAWYFGHYSAVHERDRAPHGWSRGKYALYLQIGLNVTLGFLLVFSLAAVFTLAHAAWTDDFLGFLPESFRASVEQALDIPSPAAGEGPRWHLEFRPYLWDASADPWLAPLLGVALAVLAFLIYRKESRVIGQRPGAAGRWPAVLMAVLRVGLFLLMLGILLPRLQLWFKRESWPHLVILIDESASMSVIDDYRDPKVRETADRLAMIAGLKKKERLALAQTLIAREGEDWVRALLEQRKVKVHIYRCAERASRIASVTKADEIDAGVEAIHSLEAKKSNDSSQLGAAVRQVLNDFQGTSLAAVIMLTDGVTTEGEDLRQVAKYADQKMKVPLFFVGLGDAQEPRDLEVSGLEAPSSSFVNDTLRIHVKLTARGYGPRAGPFKVRLREKDSDKVLDSKDVTPDAPGNPKQVTLEYKPTKPGIKNYIIDTPILPDEVDKRNNEQTKEIEVTEAKLIHVLYVEGYGRYEYRYLKTLLERENARLKDNKTMDLAVCLIEADPEYQKQDKSADKLKGQLPTKAQLSKYDVIILGDVDPSPHDNGKTVQFLRDVADMVRDRGRGLVMIAGERHAPHAYKDSPLRDVLPIDITSDHPPEEPEGGRTESYRPELTPKGQMHQIFGFNAEEKEKDKESIWKELREMYWYAEGYHPKPAADVLVVHPTVKAVGGVGSKEGKHPLVVHQFVGAGQAMFLGFNETWRWRWRVHEKHFNTFWIQTVRFLARSRQGRIELSLNKDRVYQRGEPITVKVRYPPDAPAPPEDTDVRVAVVNKDLQERTTLKLAHVKGSREFEGVLTRTPVGRYEFWLDRPRVPDPQPHAECEVIAPPGELERTRMNQSEMEEAARESRGRFYTLAEADQLLDDLPSGTRETRNASDRPALIWNHALLLVVALLFLSAEWILRKRYHLL